jgi:hypothetical protein
VVNRKTFLQWLGASAALGGTDLFAARSTTARPQLGMWMGNDYQSADEWKRAFERMRKAGITMVLPNTPHEKLATLDTIVPLAANEGIDVHVWRVAMLNTGPLKEHPEWYGISRSGKSTAVQPPYVDYYRFLCPNREEVQEYLRAQIRQLADVPGIKSVHLDYIRFPDVILPVGLWSKYNLVQDKEYPDFDFCYCDVCRAKFKAEGGVDPLTLADPPANAEWVQFRWDSITKIVRMFYDDVHERGKLLTAAVFPTPVLARQLVRQDWVNWSIDAVMPMIYNGFYNQPVAWVAEATRQGVSGLGATRPLYSGVYVPDLSPDDLEAATRYALGAGAAGVVYFDAHAMTDPHWDRLTRISETSARARP